jgi:ankyrin repeat protein
MRRNRLQADETEPKLPELPQLSNLMWASKEKKGGKNPIEVFFESVPENVSPFRCRDKNNNTIMHLAVQTGIAENVGLVIDELQNRQIKMGLPSQAELLKNRYGDTPVHIAAMAKDDSLLEKLCKASFPVNLKNNNGNTPLHNLAGKSSYFSEDKLRLLLQYGADMEAGNKNGNTPLHLVVDSNAEKLNVMLKVLKDPSINLPVEKYIHLENKSGQSVLNMLEERLETLAVRRDEISKGEGDGLSANKRKETISWIDNNREIYTNILEDMKGEVRSRSSSVGTTRESWSSGTSGDRWSDDGGYTGDSEDYQLKK